MNVMMKCGCAAQGVLSAIKGVPVDPPVPACVVHECYEIADAAPDLSGRTARCSCGKTAPSSPADLAFFEYRGPGSRAADEICKCGYHRVAHEAGRVKCKEFVARGPHEFDLFYCGCRGWD